MIGRKLTFEVRLYPILTWFNCSQLSARGHLSFSTQTMGNRQMGNELLTSKIEAYINVEPIRKFQSLPSRDIFRGKCNRYRARIYSQ